MATLGVIDPAREAVIYDPDLTEGSVAEYPGASRGRIVLTEYSPDRLKYDVTAPVRGLAVFSEIYYPCRLESLHRRKGGTHP